MVPQLHLDALIVFGYGPVQAGAGSGKLNLYGRLNALAGGMIFAAGDVGVIIPTGGHTGGHHLPSEAALVARVLRARFAVPEDRLVLEEQATDTLTNLVHVANIVDAQPEPWTRLGFVALGLHLPRIHEIASMVGLDGECIATEEVVRERSVHHERFLRQALHQDNESWARMREDQARGLRGLREMPTYWMPILTAVENPTRLRQILRAERSQGFLHHCGMDVESATDHELRSWLGSLHREFSN